MHHSMEYGQFFIRLIQELKMDLFLDGRTLMDWMFSFCSLIEQ